MSNYIEKSRDVPYLKNLKYVAFQPIFILGVHRSGTSILYKILVATGCFNSVTAYHLINYNDLLWNYHHRKEETAKQKLTDSFLKNGFVDRGIDTLKINADFAEEYGFLLSTQTVQMYITKKNLSLFSELCKKIQFIAGNNKPILLKNPYDFPNFLYIKRIFPNAKFIFIHRHPLKTISSTLNAIRTILKQKNPYTTQLSRIYEKFYSNPLLIKPLQFIFLKIPELSVILITRITAKATHYYLKNIEYLPTENYISITYEDFCQHPQETIETILQKLLLSAEQKINAASFIKPRKAGIDESVIKFRKYIFHSMITYCNRFNYTKEE